MIHIKPIKPIKPIIVVDMVDIDGLMMAPFINDGCCSAAFRVVRPKLEETKSKLPELSDEAIVGVNRVAYKKEPMKIWRGVYHGFLFLFFGLCFRDFQGISPFFLVVISLGFFGFCGY